MKSSPGTFPAKRSTPCRCFKSTSMKPLLRTVSRTQAPAPPTHRHTHTHTHTHQGHLRSGYVGCLFRKCPPFNTPPISRFNTLRSIPPFNTLLNRRLPHIHVGPGVSTHTYMCALTCALLCAFISVLLCALICVLSSLCSHLCALIFVLF